METQTETQTREITNDSLKLIAQTVVHSKTWKRENAIKEIAVKYIEWAKNNGVEVFSREGLNFLFSGLYKRNKTSRDLVTVVLNTMEKLKLIDQYKTLKPIYQYQNKFIGCLDSGSYSVMMSRNGYRRSYYKYSKPTKKPFNDAPKRVKMKTLGLHEQTDTQDFDYTFTQMESYKPYKKQGVITNSNKSVKKQLLGYVELKTFRIL